MQILFNKTIEQCRQLGARGGRAYARNLRLRQSQAPVPPVAQLPVPTMGNRPRGQLAPGRAVSLAGLRSPPDPPRALMPPGPAPSATLGQIPPLTRLGPRSARTVAEFLGDHAGMISPRAARPAIGIDPVHSPG